jgi:hypothetical protein
MAQRVHPNIFRVGVTKLWNYKYIEKKSIEQPNYDFKNLEIRKFIFKFFKDNNFDLYECKTNYCDNGSLHIFLAYYAIPINKNIIDDVLTASNPSVKTQPYKNYLTTEDYFTYNIITYMKKLLENDSPITQITGLKKEIQKKYLNLEKSFTFIDPFYTAHKMKLKFFLNNFIESLTIFIGKKLNIFITFQELNRSLKKNLNKKNIQLIKRSITKLNKYKDNEFFKEGVTTLYICSKYSNSANLLSEFIVRYLKKTKNPKFFLTFIKKGLTVFKKETNFKVNEIKIKIKGRITKSARARKKIVQIANKLPVLSINANINYAEKVVYTPNGTIGVKVWIYNGT